MAALLFAFSRGKIALYLWVSLQVVMANLFVMKQMDMFGLTITCSDVYAIGACLGLNLLQEYWDKEEAKKALLFSFGAMLFFTCMGQIHLLYEPAQADWADGAFQTLLALTPRISLASIASYAIVQRIDITFFGWLQKRWEGKRLSRRVFLSLLLTQGIDTVLFSFLGLWGSVHSLLAVCGCSLLVKGCAILLQAPFVRLSRRWRDHVLL